MRKLMTSEDEQKIIDLVNTGKSPVVISKELNIDYHVVYYFVNKTGIYSRCHKYTADEVRFIKENYDKMSAESIANHLKVPISSIYNKARTLKLSRFK